jgi:predicted DsbA family dithiol-disulfide isomerase
MDKIQVLNKPTVKIDVVSDVVCPWCYVGKRRLEKAIDELSAKYSFDVTYHPFELNPQMPEQGSDQRQYLTNKFGSAERYDQITKHVTEVAATEGLTFDFNKQRVSPNTRNAHRVIELAKQEAKQLEMKEAFMKAYFTDGVDLSKNGNLVSVAVSVGLSKEKVENLLSTEEGLVEVELAEKEMQKLGITGVPFYIIDNKYGISGAQPSETFKQAIEEIGAKLQLSGEACGVDGENC